MLFFWPILQGLKVSLWDCGDSPPFSVIMFYCAYRTVQTKSKMLSRPLLQSLGAWMNRNRLKISPVQTNGCESFHPLGIGVQFGAFPGLRAPA